MDRLANIILSLRFVMFIPVPNWNTTVSYISRCLWSPTYLRLVEKIGAILSNVVQMGAINVNDEYRGINDSCSKDKMFSIWRPSGLLDIARVKKISKYRPSVFAI